MNTTTTGNTASATDDIERLKTVLNHNPDDIAAAVSLGNIYTTKAKRLRRLFIIHMRCASTRISQKFGPIWGPCTGATVIRVSPNARIARCLKPMRDSATRISISDCCCVTPSATLAKPAHYGKNWLSVIQIIHRLNVRVLCLRKPSYSLVKL